MTKSSGGPPCSSWAVVPIPLALSRSCFFVCSFFRWCCLPPSVGGAAFSTLLVGLPSMFVIAPPPKGENTLFTTLFYGHHGCSVSHADKYIIVVLCTPCCQLTDEGCLLTTFVACLFLQVPRTFRFVCRQLPCSSWIQYLVLVVLDRRVQEPLAVRRMRPP